MSDRKVPKSVLFPWNTTEEVSLRKLAERAFDQVALDALVDTDIASPDQDDLLWYNLGLDQWENDSLKTVNGQSLRGSGDITITTSGALSGLSDVTITTPLNNQVLTYNGSLSRWENKALPAFRLDEAADVSVSGLVNGEALVWNSGTGFWENRSVSASAGGNPTQLQFNNTGSLGGVPGTGWDGTRLSIPRLVRMTGPDANAKEIAAVREIGVVASNDFAVGHFSGVYVRQIGSTENQEVELLATEGVASNSFKITGTGDAPTWNGLIVMHKGNLDQNAVTSVNTRLGTVTLTDTDVPATPTEWSTTTRTAALTDRGLYIYATATGAKTFEFTTATGGSSGEYHLRNDAVSGNITLTPTGVTIKPPKGGTLVLEPGDTVTIKQVTTNVFHVFGSTQAA